MYILNKNKITHDITVLVLTRQQNMIQDFVRCFFSDQINANLLILDNGSDPDIDFSFLKNNSNISTFRSDENLGVVNGRNCLLEFLLSEEENPNHIIGILDDDQLLRKGGLSKHINLLDKYDIIGLEAWKMSKDYFPIEKVKDSKRPFHYVGCGGMFFKSAVVNKVGLFDEIFNPAYFEDPDFIFRAVDLGFSVGFNDKTIVTHLPHSTLGNTNLQERSDLFTRNYQKFMNKWKDRQLDYLTN